jgi:quercetin dioxygenase-like cupin family protein
MTPNATKTAALPSKILTILLLAGIAAPVLAQPPGMMPYTAILDPQFVPATQASFLLDDDVVIGVAHGNVSKAFPAADLTQHGSVNDEMPDGPIEVTWCGTCNTGAVFRARVNGRLLHFDYDSMVGANEVHKDRETGSRWQQSTGEAISGPLKGSLLELYPFVRTTWKEWRKRYPNTIVLKPLPGYDERMPNISKRQKALALSGEGDAPKGVFGHDDRLHPKAIIAGLRVGTEEKAFPFSQLRIARVVNDRVGGAPVVIIHQPSSDTTTAFEARARGKVLRFQAADADASSLIDLETHSSWNAYGLCFAGPLKGTQLKTLILIPEFWFAWSEFHPQTKVFLASNTQSSEGISAPPAAQTPAVPAPGTQMLMKEPLGDTSEPKMSLFILNLPAGQTVPTHSHAGAVFAYLLEGNIENQVEPDPPQVIHPGGFFHERPMQVHRLFRNLSQTEPAKILIFQNTGALPPNLKPLLQEPLANTATQEVNVLRLTMGPGAESAGVHQHPGPVFAYVLKGEIETQVDPDPPKIYRAGDVFYEPPMHAHRFSRNPSKTEPAELLVFQVGEQGGPLALPVK